jgi:hypothetical protein
VTPRPGGICLRVVLVLQMASLWNGSVLLAQNQHRQGLWAELASGPARIRLHCAECSSVVRAAGTGGYLRVGGTLSPKVLMGIEFYGFSDETFSFSGSDSSLVAASANVNAIMLWYPWRSHFNIKAGVGLAAGAFTLPPVGTDTVEAAGYGVGLTFGLGWDIPISRKLALTGNAAVFFSAIGDIRLPTVVVEDVIPTTYLLSLGISVR